MRFVPTGVLLRMATATSLGGDEILVVDLLRYLGSQFHRWLRVLPRDGQNAGYGQQGQQSSEELFATGRGPETDGTNSQQQQHTN